MKIRIVCDSSSNVYDLPGVDFAAAPLKIIFSGKEFVDTADLDTARMLKELAQCKGRSTTSCPNVQDYLDAFQGADAVIALTISSKMSGSYNAAVQACREFEEQDPSHRSFVLDTLNAGPGMQLILEDLRAALLDGADFDRLVEVARDSRIHSKLIFALKSLNNMARNGRCSMALAKFAGLLDIRLVGRASEDGDLDPRAKARGCKKTLETIVREMEANGFRGGTVRISHGHAPQDAEALRDLILARWPQAEIRILVSGGLCCFYAEAGGLMIGFSDR